MFTRPIRAAVAAIFVAVRRARDRPALRAQPQQASTPLCSPASAGARSAPREAVARFGVAGSSSRPNESYFGATGGGLGNDRRWRHLAPGLGWLLQVVVGRRRRGGRVPAGRRLRRDGGGPASRQRHPGRRHLQVFRRRTTWAHVGLASTWSIGRIRVHPGNPDIVYVAALGDLYGPNAERGVFKSTDGGKTWESVLFRNNQTGAVEFSMDPKNPDVLYAGFWEVFRTPHSLSSGGPGSGLFKTSDGGKTGPN